MRIIVSLDKELDIDDIYNMFDRFGILGDSYNEVYNDCIEVINLESFNDITEETKSNFERLGLKAGTELKEFESKWFFRLEDLGIGEFSFGGYIVFYEDDNVIGELGESYNDQVLKDWNNNINEFCEENGWKVLS